MSDADPAAGGAHVSPADQDAIRLFQRGEHISLGIKGAIGVAVILALAVLVRPFAGEQTGLDVNLAFTLVLSFAIPAEGVWIGLLVRKVRAQRRRLEAQRIEIERRETRIDELEGHLTNRDREIGRLSRRLDDLGEASP